MKKMQEVENNLELSKLKDLTDLSRQISFSYYKKPSLIVKNHQIGNKLHEK